MTEYSRELMYGKRPIRRNHPRLGQSRWYYMDPRYDNDDARCQIDVENENTPNPQAGEIQNYLYQNDEHNYKELYGNTPPQPTNPAANTPEDTESLLTKGWNALKGFGDATEAETVAFMSGLTLGNFDEGMGATTAALTRNPNNYRLGRDAVRQLQNDLRAKYPKLYEASEFVGSAVSPMHLSNKVSAALKVRPKLMNAITDTALASLGYTEDWKDFNDNLATNGMANYLGYKVDSLLPATRNAAKPIRQILKNAFSKQGANYFADKTKSLVYNDDNIDSK